MSIKILNKKFGKIGKKAVVGDENFGYLNRLYVSPVLFNNPGDKIK